MLYFKNIIFVSLFLKDITKGADLTLVFMDELNKETMAMSYYYKMADKKTTILIKREALFATENIAHEIGHVLGAGHGPDISKLKLRLLECYVDPNSLF
jgi:predicted Zn-dependent protease